MALVGTELWEAASRCAAVPTPGSRSRRSVNSQRPTPMSARTWVYEMQRVVADDVPMLSLYVPTRVIAFDEQIFDAWYFTPGGVWGAYPGALNKHAFITGRRTDL